MFDFVNYLGISPAAALTIYFVAGLILFHDMKRIRWYAFSAMWVYAGSFDRGLLVETTMLAFAYVLSESFFNTYSEHYKAKAIKSDDA